VLFDLDGTLVDSFAGIADAYRYLLGQLHLGDLDEEDLRKLVGPSIREVLLEHFGLSGSQLEEAVEIFRQHYGDEGLLNFTKYPGVDELLETMHGRGLQLCIATSKMATMAAKVVDRAGWSALFTFIGGAEDTGRYRKEDVIRWTLHHVPHETRVLAMVGDRAADILGARTLGLEGIGVTWGYGEVRELVAAGASAIVSSPQEVLTAIADAAP
jgi:phosphoglycolate phosphatase